jgi:hypothetical protein
VETFFVGTHQPYWLGTVDAPLCVSRRRLTGRKSYPRALAPWLLDSGGFTELTLYGRWTLSPAEYVAEARVYAREIGHLAHCAPQDHMCEPIVLRRTGLSTEAHQALTVSNYLDLRERAPELPWFPGLKMQGLVKAADALTSADSMAWSFHARKQGRAWCGSTVHRNCANCPRFALHWRERVLDLVARAAAGSRQLTLWDVA